MMCLFFTTKLFSMDYLTEIEKYLGQACKDGNLVSVNHILLNDVISVKSLIKSYQTEKKQTPLHLAAKNGHLTIIDALFHAGFDINNKGVYGITPLGLAIAIKNEPSALKLIDLGAQLNLKDDGGGMVLDYAIGINSETIIRALIQHGSPLFSKNGSGDIPLDHILSTDSIRKIILHAMQKEIDRATIERRPVK